MAKANSRTGGKPTAPHNGGAFSQSDLAKGAHDVLKTTHSALQIWINAARCGCDIDEHRVEFLRGSIEAIDESMQEADVPCMNLEEDTMDFWRARHLMRLIEQSLWNAEGGEINAPDAEDLAATADLALDYLVSLSTLLGNVAGRAQ